jgi:hypothetical protein
VRALLEAQVLRVTDDRLDEVDQYLAVRLYTCSAEAMTAMGRESGALPCERLVKIQPSARRAPMGRYIGLDAHAQTCTFAVMGPISKRLREALLAFRPLLRFPHSAAD